MTFTLGADVMTVLDECPSADGSKSYVRKSSDLTLRWAEHAKARFKETDPRYGHEQAPFSIVHGVVYPEARRPSARALANLGFPGYAIGGLSASEPHEQMYEMVSVTTAELPSNKPRYLMGVGIPANLLECVARAAIQDDRFAAWTDEIQHRVSRRL